MPYESAGDPKTQQCTEMMRVLAEKIRLGEAGSRAHDTVRKPVSLSQPCPPGSYPVPCLPSQRVG